MRNLRSRRDMVVKIQLEISISRISLADSVSDLVAVRVALESVYRTMRYGRVANAWLTNIHPHI